MLGDISISYKIQKQNATQQDLSWVMYQDPAETSPQFSTISFKEVQDFDNLLIFQIVGQKEGVLLFLTIEEELLQETSFVMNNQTKRASITR